MKYCLSTDVGTWTNWLTFEPDPGYSPYRIVDIIAALLRGILCRENRTYAYWRLQRGVVLLTWFYSVSRRNTFVGGKCAPPSSLLVVCNSHGVAMDVLIRPV